MIEFSTTLGKQRNMRRFRGREIRRPRAQLGLPVLGHNLRVIHKLRQSKIPKPANENLTKKTRLKAGISVRQAISVLFPVFSAFQACFASTDAQVYAMDR